MGGILQKIQILCHLNLRSVKSETCGLTTGLITDVAQDKDGLFIAVMSSPHSGQDKKIRFWQLYSAASGIYGSFNRNFKITCFALSFNGIIDEMYLYV